MSLAVFIVDALTISLIAVGLAIDAFAVSIANGMSITHNRKRSALSTATAFGGFQMLMPIFGYIAGINLANIISNIDHWIAFGLLAFIGAKMFYDGLRKEKPQNGSANLKLRTLIVLAIATSIDALMVGLSFAFLQTDIMLPVTIIGAVTFGLSFMGFYFGSGLGQHFGHRIKLVGGFVLFLIGLRILFEHLFS